MTLEQVAREAAVINLLDIADTDDLLDRVKTELWCIREGIDTQAHPEIWDITLGDWTTSGIINIVMYSGARGKQEQAAFLLCTMSEIS